MEVELGSHSDRVGQSYCLLNIYQRIIEWVFCDVCFSVGVPGWDLPSGVTGQDRTRKELDRKHSTGAECLQSRKDLPLHHCLVSVARNGAIRPQT